MRVLPTSQLFLLHCVTLFCVAVERPAMFIIRRCACATHTLQAVHRTGQGKGGFVGAGRDWALALPSQSCQPTGFRVGKVPRDVKTPPRYPQGLRPAYTVQHCEQDCKRHTVCIYTMPPVHAQSMHHALRPCTTSPSIHTAHLLLGGTSHALVIAPISPVCNDGCLGHVGSRRRGFYRLCRIVQ